MKQYFVQNIIDKKHLFWYDNKALAMNALKKMAAEICEKT